MRKMSIFQASYRDQARGSEFLMNSLFVLRHILTVDVMFMSAG
jgi:hypothetical protein